MSTPAPIASSRFLGIPVQASPLLDGMTRAIRIGNNVVVSQETYDRMMAAKSPEELEEVLRGVGLCDVPESRLANLLSG